MRKQPTEKKIRLVIWYKLFKIHHVINYTSHTYLEFTNLLTGAKSSLFSEQIILERNLKRKQIFYSHFLTKIETTCSLFQNFHVPSRYKLKI